MRFINRVLEQNQVEVLAKEVKQVVKTKTFTMERINCTIVYETKLKIMAKSNDKSLQEYMDITGKKPATVKKEIKKLLQGVSASTTKKGDVAFVTPEELRHLAESFVFYLQTADGKEVTDLSDLDWGNWSEVEVGDNGAEPKVEYSR